MDDKERTKLVQKLQKDVEDYVSSLKPKKYEDGWPEDRWQEEMEKHPIFMSKPIEDGQEIPPLVEALQQLKYDPEFNSSVELAMSYKEDGNQNFKKEKYQWAVDSYTKGLDAKCEDKELDAILYSNRAAAQYHLGNYRKALEDATEAKALKPQYIKAISHGASCCLELKLWEDCISWCDEVLKLDPSNKLMTDLKKKANDMKEKAEQSKKEYAEKALQEEKELKLLNKAIRKRGIKFEGTGLAAKSLEPVYPEASSTKVYLTPENVLIWPVIFLYPEYEQSDYIQAFNEHSCFCDHLEAMFNEPPNWDIEKKYVPENLQVYFCDSDRFLIPVDKTKCLKSVMRHKRFKLQSGTLSFIVTVINSEFDRSYRSKWLSE